ncbi:hypothetical protein E2320_015984 [Naja naja]|nr:hypothetical protein E2320_015984 [Naja naja]
MTEKESQEISAMPQPPQLSEVEPSPIHYYSPYPTTPDRNSEKLVAATKPRKRRDQLINPREKEKEN